MVDMQRLGDMTASEIADVGRELDGLLAGLITLLGGEIPAQRALTMR
jgi:hypothetical protein